LIGSPVGSGVALGLALGVALGAALGVALGLVAGWLALLEGGVEAAGDEGAAPPPLHATSEITSARASSVVITRIAFFIFLSFCHILFCSYHNNPALKMVKVSYRNHIGQTFNFQFSIFVCPG